MEDLQDMLPRKSGVNETQILKTPVMEQHRKLFYYLVLLAAVNYSCEQIIDIDLEAVNPVLVIEADLSSPDGVLEVEISRTANYFESGPAQKVDDASVYLENRLGMQGHAEPTGNGTYKLTQVMTETGDSFKLLVELDGVTYTAVSTVRAPVNIDSISYSYYEGDSFFRPGYRFNLMFKDTPGEKNYYRVRVYKNGYLFNRPNDLVVFDDADHDGKPITVRLHSQYYVEKGETAVFELLSIDRHAWEYFRSFGDLLNAGPDSPAPANPVSNFNNNAMGYFYAWSYSRKEVVVE